MYWKYQFELSSKYDREHDFDIILCTEMTISHTLLQAEMDMLQAFKMSSHDKLKHQVSQ